MTVIIGTENQQHNVVPSRCKFIVIDVRVNELYTFEEILELAAAEYEKPVQAAYHPDETYVHPLDHPLVKAGVALGRGYFGSPTTSDKALMPFPTLKWDQATAPAVIRRMNIFCRRDPERNRYLYQPGNTTLMKLWQKTRPPCRKSSGLRLATTGNGSLPGSLRYSRLAGTYPDAAIHRADRPAGTAKNRTEEYLPGYCRFRLQDDVEDIHSQVELLLTQRLGDMGKENPFGPQPQRPGAGGHQTFSAKRAGRTGDGDSNPCLNCCETEQKPTAMICSPVIRIFNWPCPLPSGLWFGAYAESLVDDVVTLRAAYEVVNKNPAGFRRGLWVFLPDQPGTDDKTPGFEDLNYNVVYAQMGRGKGRTDHCHGPWPSVADTLAGCRWMPACFSTKFRFHFISAELHDRQQHHATHKKNPDVFELIRSHCNRLRAPPNEILMMTTNLPLRLSPRS